MAIIIQKKKETRLIGLKPVCGKSEIRVGGEVAVKGFSQSRPNAVAPSVIRYRLPDILFMNKSK